MSDRDSFPPLAASALAGGVDLLGAPWRAPRDRRGRPSYAKTKENQELVALLASQGWKARAIAIYMGGAAGAGPDEKTIRKHFSRELEIGAIIVAGQMLEIEYTRARAGNLTAVKLLKAGTELGLAARHAAPQTDSARHAAPQTDSAQPEALPEGKKAQAAARAAKPAGRWARH